MCIDKTRQIVVVGYDAKRRIVTQWRVVERLAVTTCAATVNRIDIQFQRTLCIFRVRLITAAATIA
jgi:hypothetical protein